MYHRPYLKWAGGKFKQLDFIYDKMPGGRRFVEPFVGAGSVFMNVAGFEAFLLADTNKDLINTYQQIKNNPKELMIMALRFFIRCEGKDGYMMMRDCINSDVFSPIERAAAFIFLNRNGFNALARYNSEGKLNVPYRNEQAAIPYGALNRFSATDLSHHEFNVSDFTTTLDQAGSGDVVYCDPPYLPSNIDIHGNSVRRNKMYSENDFYVREHELLIEKCILAHSRGAKILINNSRSDFSIQLYKNAGFEVFDVIANRSISRDSNGRKNVTDILARLS